MTKLTRSPLFALAAIASLAVVANARAQGTGLAITAPKAAPAQIASGEVATMAFAVRNDGRDTAVAEPKVIVPAGWRVVMSPAATVIAPGEGDIWLVSVKAPATATAGTYAVHLQASRQAVAARGPMAAVPVGDSVIVSIAERHEVSVRSTGSLSYVMGGTSYVGTFVVQNLGNVPARFDLSARSTQGNAPMLVSEVMALAPGQVDTVRATVVIPGSVSATAEEVLLLTVADVAVDSVRAEATMQATVVPAARNAPTLWTVPAEFALRTSTAGSGVSAFTANGYGKLTQNGDVTVDFMLRGPTGPSSMFGEQETYRMALRSKSSSVRLGDDSYGFSELLTTGARGTGAEVRHQLANGLATGAYVQRDRGRAGAPTEMSAMLATDGKRAVSASVVALQRSASGSSTQALALATAATIGSANLGVELAASDSQQTRGNSGRVHLRGDASLFIYDLAAERVSSGFASGQRGSSDLRASIVSNRLGSVTLAGNTMLHRSNGLELLNGPGQRVSNTSLAASWASGVSVEGAHFDRRDEGGFSPVSGTMETMNLRGRYALGILDATMNLHTGLVAQADTASRSSVGVGSALTARFGDASYVSVFGEYGDGRGLGESGNATLTAGMNSQVQVKRTTLRAMSYLTQATLTGKWGMQSDVTIEQALSRATLALRGRLATSASAPAVHAVFLEVRTPLGVPTSPVNTIGRARVEVLDGETGRGVAGALIRIDGHAAVTDARGLATFRDLKPGQHRVLVDGAAVAGRVVANGGEVSISATSRKPAEFNMSLSRGARIMAKIRSFERTSATIANGGDTLTEVSAVGQVTVALVTPTDTLWQTSDDRGRVDFGSLAPGRYVVAIPRHDTPDHMVFAQKEFTIDVVPGEQKQVDFKLVPVVRAVEFQGEAVLIAVPATAPKAAPASSTITGKAQKSPVTTSRPDESTVTTKTSAPVTSPATSPERSQRQQQNQRNQRNQRQQNNQDQR